MWKICFALVALVTGSQGSINDTDCFVKELTRSSLELAKDAIDKATKLFPNCNDSSECGEKESARAFLQIAKNLISEANHPIHPSSECSHEGPPIDCTDVLRLGNNSNGVYEIWPKSLRSNASVHVYCDMETDGGGWTLIQRRSNLSVTQDFNQDWESYKKGFGNLKGEFWLGNENISIISNQGRYAVRFDLRNFKGDQAYAVYNHFWIENEDALYKLHASNYSGNAGDSFAYHSGRKFATKDRDKTVNRCASLRRVGFWMYDCARANINGLPNQSAGSMMQIYWREWKDYEKLAGTEMKIRRIY